MERVENFLNKVIEKYNFFRKEHPVMFLLIVTVISFCALWKSFSKISFFDYSMYPLRCIFKFISGFWIFIDGDYYMDEFIVPSVFFIFWLLWIILLWFVYLGEQIKDEKKYQLINSIYYKTRLFLKALWPMIIFLFTFTINLFVSFYFIELDYEIDIIIGYMILLCLGIYIGPKIQQMWKKCNVERSGDLNKIKDFQGLEKIERKNEFIKFHVNEVNFKIEMELKIVTFVIGILISNSLLFNSNGNFLNICILEDKGSCTTSLIEVILTMSLLYVYIIILKVITLLNLKEILKSEMK